MATIVTVHGTNASGPERGTKWWQKQSPFEQHLRELVESDDGELHYQPLIWDGANSESSRRAAGRELHLLIKELEEKKEPYCLLGHSHGGSVIAAALMNCSTRKQKLPNLRRWITIGTPFIQPRKVPFLFSRLGRLGKAAYLSVLTLTLLLLMAAFNDPDLAELGLLIFTVVLLCLPFVIIYFVLRALNARGLRAHKKRYQRYANATFAERWIPLFHPGDEAILGLKSLETMRINVFSRNFAVPMFSFLSLFIVPVALLYAITSEQMMLLLFPHVKDLIGHAPSIVRDGELVGAGKDLTVNFDVMMTSISSFFQLMLNEDLSHVLTLIAVPIGIYALSLAITSLVEIGSKGVSAIMSRFMNSITWGQVRRLALGNDTQSERLVAVQEWPAWSGPRAVPLPEPLADEISEFSNNEAAKSIAKFRDAVGHLAFADAKEDKASVVESYLGWNELIHTCYFNVPRFRKLLIYAIAKCDGFRPTQAFLRDPDFHRVAAWYDEIMQTPQEASEGYDAPRSLDHPTQGTMTAPAGAQ